VAGRVQRLDYIIHCNNFLVFAGEHKTKDQTTVENFGTADFREKFHSTWNGVIMHGLPYLPVYTACGKWIRFYLLRPALDNSLDIVSIDEKALDCTSAVDRAIICRRALNLIFIFTLLASTSSRPEFAIKKLRPGDTTTPVMTLENGRDSTTIFLNRAEKKCIAAPAAVYNAVSSIPGSISISVGRQIRGKCTITTSPVYSQVIPLTLKQLVRAILHVLGFLIEFHRRGLNHRDVRWPNILRTGEGSWVLIDFELSAADGSLAPGDNQLDPEKRPPESRSVKSMFTSAGDIWQVGMLVVAWSKNRKVKLPQTLETLVANMMDDVPGNRPDAASAHHRFLSFL
jgi:hypothetical protein